MLAVVPAPQLEAIIARTSVPREHRRAFLGQAAAAMLATLGAVRSATAVEKFMPAPEAIPSPPKEKTLEQRVIEVISKRTGVEAKDIKRSDTHRQGPQGQGRRPGPDAQGPR